MPIDTTSETLIAVNQISKHLPGKVSLPTIWRWIGKGCRGVQLESISVGGRRYVALSALGRFIDATTAKQPHAPAAPSLRTSKQREAAIRRAEQIVGTRRD